MRGGDSGGGQGWESKVKATKTSGRGNASPSYNPPRDCNISSYIHNYIYYNIVK